MPSCAITISIPIELVQNLLEEARQKGYATPASLIAHEYLGAPVGRRGPSSMSPHAEKNLQVAAYARLLCKRKRTPEEAAVMPAMRDKLRALTDVDFEAAFDAKGALLDSALPPPSAEAALPYWQRKPWTLAKLRKLDDQDLDMMGMSAEQIANLRAGKRP